MVNTALSLWIYTMLTYVDLHVFYMSVVVTGGDYSVPYIDVKDAQWRCDGELIPVDIKNISASQFVIYKFGVFVSQLMQELIGSPEVSILLASNLPPNDYVRNAYRLESRSGSFFHLSH